MGEKRKKDKKHKKHKKQKIKKETASSKETTSVTLIETASSAVDTVSKEPQIQLEGGQDRVNKFLRLMGAKKNGIESVKQLENVSKVNQDLEKAFDQAMDIKRKRKGNFALGSK